MDGIAFVNFRAPETIEMTDGRKLLFRYRKQVFTDPYEIEWLRLLVAENGSITEAGESSDEAVKFERDERERTQQEANEQWLQDLLTVQRREADRIRTESLARHKENQARWEKELKAQKRREKNSDQEKAKAQSFVEANAPKDSDSARVSAIKIRIVENERAKVEGRISEPEATRIDLLLREAIDEAEFGIPGIIIDGVEHTTAELTLRLEALKRS